MNQSVNESNHQPSSKFRFSEIDLYHSLSLDLVVYWGQIVLTPFLLLPSPFLYRRSPFLPVFDFHLKYSLYESAMSFNMAVIFHYFCYQFSVFIQWTWKSLSYAKWLYVYWRNIRCPAASSLFFPAPPPSPTSSYFLFFLLFFFFSFIFSSAAHSSSPTSEMKLKLDIE